MNKEKQIEEIVDLLSDAVHEYNIAFANYIRDSKNYPAPTGEFRAMAEALYNAEYRKQIKGEWLITDGGSPLCSNCETEIDDVCKMNNYDFCPHCGVKMKR